MICGHCHWEQPLAQLPAGCQVLNVDARVVVLLRERVEPQPPTTGVRALREAPLL